MKMPPKIASFATNSVSTFASTGANEFYIDWVLSAGTSQYMILRHTLGAYNILACDTITGGGIYTATPFSMETPFETLVTFRMIVSVNDNNVNTFVSGLYDNQDKLKGTLQNDSTTVLLAIPTISINMSRQSTALITVPIYLQFVNVDLGGLTIWANSGVSSIFSEDTPTTLKVTLDSLISTSTYTSVRVLQ